MNAFAPGRINLLGEHTDYNGGYVLPTVLELGTTVEVEPRQGGPLENGVEVFSQEAKDLELGPAQHRFEIGHEKKTDQWTDFVEGLFVTARKLDLPTHGVRIHLDSNLPIGAGLSSSASLSIALIRALGALWNWKLTPLDRALLAQRIENEWIGVGVGILDPLAIEIGQKGSATFIDTETPATSFEAVALPRGFEVAVFHTGISHRLSEGGYNQRRKECFEAAQILGFQTLREFQKKSDQGLHSEKFQSLAPVLQKRVTHIWNENLRVREAVSALKAGNLQKLGLLWKESHDSLSHLYEVSLPEVDEWVRLASLDPDVLGARMTGGGFGGAILILTHEASAERVAVRIKDQFRTLHGSKGFHSGPSLGRLLTVVRGS